MSQEHVPGKINVVDKSASDVLLDAVSLVGEDCQVIIILKNRQDGQFSLLANCSQKDAHWMMSQARHLAIDSTLYPESVNAKEEGGEGEENG